jgi:hypothetical protein
VADPKRLLESTQDALSPNVLVQNLLGVARTESAPDGARRRARRSIDGVFASPPGSVEATGSTPLKSASSKGSVAKSPSAKATPAKNPGSPPKSMPPKSMPPAERRPAGCGEPCAGTPFGII